jgi:Flp pilus assembly protein TadD
MKAQARWMLQSDQAGQAVALLQDGMARLGADAEAHGLLGAALSRSGNDAASVSHFEQAVRLEPQRASNHFNLGVAYEKLGRLDWALEGYRQALLRDPAFEPAIMAYYRLAQSLADGPSAETPLPPQEEQVPPGD